MEICCSIWRRILSWICSLLKIVVSIMSLSIVIEWLIWRSVCLSCGVWSVREIRMCGR